MFKKIAFITTFIIGTLTPSISISEIAGSQYYTEPVTCIVTPVTKLSKNELFSIFTLHTTVWDTGGRVIVVMYPSDSPILKSFVLEHFGLNPYRFQEMLDTRLNNGRAQPPIVVNNEKEMMREIERGPGRIGFIRSYVLVGEPNGNIKKIHIE